MRPPAPLVFLVIRPTEGWSVVAVPARAWLVLLEPPSLCWKLFDDEVAGAGLELLLELARPGFEPRSPAAGVYAITTHAQTNVAQFGRCLPCKAHHCTRTPC